MPSSGSPASARRRLREAGDGFHEAAAALSGGDGAAALASADAGLRFLPGEENLRFVRAGKQTLAATGAHDR